MASRTLIQTAFIETDNALHLLSAYNAAEAFQRLQRAAARQAVHFEPFTGRPYGRMHGIRSYIHIIGARYTGADYGQMLGLRWWSEQADRQTPPSAHIAYIRPTVDVQLPATDFLDLPPLHARYEWSELEALCSAIEPTLDTIIRKAHQQQCQADIVPGVLR